MPKTKVKPKAKPPADDLHELLRQYMTLDEAIEKRLRLLKGQKVSIADLGRMIDDAFDFKDHHDDGAGRCLCTGFCGGFAIWVGTVKRPKRAPDLLGDRVLFAVARAFGLDLVEGKNTAEVQAGFSGNSNDQLPIQPAAKGKR